VAVQHVIAGAADQDVIAVAAIGNELDTALKTGSDNDIVSVQPVDDELVAGTCIGDVHLGCKTRHRDHAVGLGHGDDVGTTGPVNRDRVCGAVIGAEVEIDLLDTGPGQIIDRDVVGASQSVEINVLDAVQVHGDAG